MLQSSLKFSVAVALTDDHALMACAFLAKLRLFHPECELFVITDRSSASIASSIATVFDAHEPVVVDHMGFDCLEWGAIVTAKFRVFSLPTSLPIMFLDIDQVLTRPLTTFVDHFARSNLVLAGGADDETLGRQFQDGHLPAGLDGDETRVINTGAFITRPDPAIAAMIRSAIPSYSGRTRLPTQGLINGILHKHGLDFHVFGDEFMIGPFNRRVADRPSTAALIHLWTPRPPFMFPNPQRTGVDGDLSWEDCTVDYQRETGQAYPTRALRDEYMAQMDLFERNFGHRLPDLDRPAGHRHHYAAYLRDSMLATDFAS